MLTYTASQILDAAADVADIKNSAFISHREKVRVLNECFRELYQYCLASGDKTWERSFEVGGVSAGADGWRVDLPSDFLQLESITLKNTGQALLRRGGTETPYAPRYEIVNNQLAFYGSIADTLVVKYFPIPPTLSAPDDEEGNEVAAPDFEAGAVDVAFGGGVYGGATYTHTLPNAEMAMEGSLQVSASVVTAGGVVATVEHTFENVQTAPIAAVMFTAAQSFALAFFEAGSGTEGAAHENDRWHIYLYDIPLKRGYGVASPHATFFDDGGRVVCFAHEGGEADEGDGYFYCNGKITSETLAKKWDAVNWRAAADATCGAVSKNLLAHIEKRVTKVTTAGAGGTAGTEERVDWAVVRTVDGKDETVTVLTDGAETARVYDVRGFVAYGNAGGFTVMAMDTYGYAPYVDTDISAFWGAEEGGRYCVTSNYGGKPVLREYAADTVLDYPNAFFFPCLEYMIAVRYKMKQGDQNGMAAIATVLEERMGAFYKSIPRDAFAQSRINNFYGGAYL